MYVATLDSIDMDSADSRLLPTSEKYEPTVLREGQDRVGKKRFPLTSNACPMDASAGNCTCDSALLYENDILPPVVRSIGNETVANTRLAPIERAPLTLVSAGNETVVKAFVV